MDILVYSTAVGVGLATFSRSVIKRSDKWIVDVLLIMTRIWFVADQSFSNIILLFGYVGYYPGFTDAWGDNPVKWNMLILLSMISIAYSLVQYGLPDTIQYNSHYIGVMLYGFYYQHQLIPSSLIISLGVFDLVTIMYAGSTDKLRPFAVILFAVVRVGAFGLLMHFEEFGMLILAFVFSCQLWILYIMIMRFAATSKKKKKRKK